MKHLIAIATIAALFSMNAAAQDSKVVTGYLVDKMCSSSMVKKAPAEAMLKAAKHTKTCCLETDCAKSGYGIITDGKFVKFDENGDKKAHELLTKTKLEDHILVEAAGTMQGDRLSVSTLKEAARPAKKPAKKM